MGLLALMLPPLRDTLLMIAVINPIGNIPTYADLTGHLVPNDRVRVINLAVLVALCIVVAFSLIGNWCLTNVFNVTLMELKIAGGILLFGVAIRGVMRQVAQAATGTADERMLAVFPIAFPIMVGPGAITMTIILGQRNGQFRMVMTACLTFMAVFLVARNAHRLMRLLGQYAGLVIARVLYIFLAAKAVAMILDGVEQFLQKL